MHTFIISHFIENFIFKTKINQLKYGWNKCNQYKYICYR